MHVEGAVGAAQLKAAVALCCDCHGERLLERLEVLLNVLSRERAGHGFEDNLLVRQEFNVEGQGRARRRQGDHLGTQLFHCQTKAWIADDEAVERLSGFVAGFDFLRAFSIGIVSASSSRSLCLSDAKALCQSLVRSRDESRRLPHHYMAMRLWVHALRVHAKVLGEVVDEDTLARLHRLEAKALLVVGCGKHTELAFLHLGPLGALAEQVESLCRIRDVIATFSVQ